ncbi:hypothetical protein ACWDRR_26795 [Kitasatospora sp. NPDC003701]
MSNDPSRHGLTGVAKTLLTPLYGRAHADRLLPDGGFHDPLAAAVLAGTGFRPDEVLTDRSNAVGAIHRAIVFDRADFFHPWVARSGLHPIVRATGARFRSGARGARGLAGAAPGWTATAEHPVMERIGTAQRISAALLRIVLRGHRPYAVADLRAGGGRPRHA